MKGQGAMEYLMTYGWALLVIVVVGVALYGLGVLNPSTYTQEGCRGFGTMTYQGHEASTSRFAVEFVNGEVRAITPTAISVDGTAVTNFASSPAAPSAGERYVVQGDITLPAGDYQSSIVMTYDVSGGITNKTDIGTCTGVI